VSGFGALSLVVLFSACLALLATSPIVSCWSVRPIWEYLECSCPSVLVNVCVIAADSSAHVVIVHRAAADKMIHTAIHMMSFDALTWPPRCWRSMLVVCPVVVLCVLERRPPWLTIFVSSAMVEMLLFLPSRGAGRRATFIPFVIVVLMVSAVRGAEEACCFMLVLQCIVYFYNTGLSTWS